MGYANDGEWTEFFAEVVASGVHSPSAAIAQHSNSHFLFFHCFLGSCLHAPASRSITPSELFIEDLQIRGLHRPPSSGYSPPWLRPFTISLWFDPIFIILQLYSLN
nr:hypothetical protein Iba_chr07cCG12690 [Ipomoea batatas]